MGKSSTNYTSKFGEMSETDAIRYDGWWKHQEAINSGVTDMPSIYDNWYKPNTSADGYKATAKDMNFPQHGGAIPNTQTMVTLEPGMEVGRYGEPTKLSDYVTETGLPPERLSLPPITNHNEYFIYKVAKPIPNVERAVAAPYIGDPGLGIQYKLPKPIKTYINDGYLIKK
ncbi:MAG: TNT domain-containing protein [Cardiobacteriaceae bacterium]|nr:TNT domain-containing protein [Cardiobacteriaceae bacterium]